MGDYQSLFQLAAALSIGILALESLLDSPASKVRPSLQGLLGQITSVFTSSPRPEDFDHHKASFLKLQSDVKTAFVSSPLEWEYRTLRFGGLLVSAISIWFLIDSSERYSHALVPMDRNLAIALVFLPLALTIVLVWISTRKLAKLNAQYNDLERRFFELVDTVWGLNKRDTDTGVSAGSGGSESDRTAAI